MTVRPAFESPREPEGDAILRAVGTARRRLRTVSALRLGAVAAPGGVALGAGLALAGWAPWWTAAALGALGAAGAAAWAATHTPTVTTVARILDAHLELRDRVSAALQLRQTGGPVAALVARDAAARLAPVDLTALFPLAIGRAPAVATAVAVAMVAWLAAGGVDRRGPATAATSSDGSASESSEPGARARAGARAAAPEPARQPAGQRSVRETRAPGRAPTDGDTTSRAASDASSRPALTDPRPTAGDQERPVSRLAETQQAAAASMASAATGASGRGGAAAGRTTGGAMTSGAGGASGQALAASPGGGTIPLAASLGAARTQAEAALARDVIPPDHREHVRAYFRAIATEPGRGGSR
jgi:hypothetical protein